MKFRTLGVHGRIAYCCENIYESIRIRRKKTMFHWFFTSNKSYHSRQIPQDTRKIEFDLWWLDTSRRRWRRLVSRKTDGDIKFRTSIFTSGKTCSPLHRWVEGTKLYSLCSCWPGYLLLFGPTYMIYLLIKRAMYEEELYLTRMKVNAVHQQEWYHTQPWGLIVAIQHGLIPLVFTSFPIFAMNTNTALHNAKWYRWTYEPSSQTFCYLKDKE